MALTRRLLLAALVATLAQPARADDVVIDIHLGTGAGPLRAVRNPQAVLYGGETVDGLPLRRGRGMAVVPWSVMRHLVFIPGDPPAALVTYRDGSESVVEIRPCRFVSGATVIDIHDVAEIELR